MTNVDHCGGVEGGVTRCHYSTVTGDSGHWLRTEQRYKETGTRGPGQPSQALGHPGLPLHCTSRNTKEPQPLNLHQVNTSQSYLCIPECWAATNMSKSNYRNSSILMLPVIATWPWIFAAPGLLCTRHCLGPRVLEAGPLPRPMGGCHYTLRYTDTSSNTSPGCTITNTFFQFARFGSSCYTNGEASLSSKALTFYTQIWH